MNHPARLAALRRNLSLTGLDAFLISRPENRRYISGFKAEDGALTESSGYLLLTQEEAFVLTDFRYQEEAQEETDGYQIRVYNQGLAKLLADLAGELGFKVLGFEEDYLLYRQYRTLTQELKGLELKPTPDLVADLRIIKEPAEVEAMEASLALIEEVLDELMEDLHPGMREDQAAWRIVSSLREKGAGTAFDPIVASGPNGAKPHAVPGSRQIREGETIVMDAGARLEGYCSDITRTAWLGPFSDKFKEVYSVVREAQLTAIRGIKPEMTAVEADALAREVIKKAGYGEAFGHSLGHGVGLATHEQPNISPLRSTRLLPGMIHTIEPGIYLPGWGGIRLEIMALITESGCRVLGGLDRFYTF